MSDAPGRHNPQVCPPPLRAEPAFRTGPAPCAPVSVTRPSEPRHHQHQTAAQNPKGRGVRTSLFSRGPQKPRGARGSKGREGRGSTKPPIRPPGTLSLPAQHARRERLQASSPPRFLNRARGWRPMSGPPMQFHVPAPVSAAPTAPKASQGLPQGIAQVRPRHNRLQDK
ncbi:hypothetical protein NDU88_008853 [Pleurodeles waltl]|uniref:Uncharacterized protein n=1 Tax=Pleurodeles waltl TaxID=8319 RepID=A0AAV7NXS1_PLEWA|nr:hypothetical protein NDU88_008853 [Pleurodeles waltl]